MSESSARKVALEVIRRVFTQAAYASAALRSALAEHDLSDPDRALVTELVYGVVRNRGTLDRALTRAAGKRLKDLDPKLHDVLRLAAYQIMYLDRVPDHAAVDEAVDLARERRGQRGAGQTNAILRKLVDTFPEDRLPTPTELHEDAVRAVAEQGGLPHDLAELLVDDLGPAEALAFGRASLQPAPLHLRANRLRTSTDALIAEVGGRAGTVACSVELELGANRLPADLPCVKEGRATPQDEASMRVVELVAPEPGERVFDLCAAPGGKTTHLAELMNDRGAVVAYDRLPKRRAMVERAAKRLGLSGVQVVDLLPPVDEPFDRVLVDAPCSGLGTLRRHPEIRWKFRRDDLDALTQTQAEVLAQGAERVRPGGVLVYSVCTVTRAEGPERIAALGDAFELEQELRTGPHQDGHPDGFYAARLRRRG